MDPRALPLPRRLEADPRASAVRAVVAADVRPLWSGGTLGVSRLTLSAPLATALRRARRAERLQIGLEQAADALASQRAGVAARGAGGPQGVARLSRLLLVSEDGAERFYRRVERLLTTDAATTLGIVLAVDAGVLGAAIGLPGKGVKLVLLDHKDAVTEALLALVTP